MFSLLYIIFPIFLLHLNMAARPLILCYFREYSCFSSVQFSSVAQSCPILCHLMNHSMPGLPVHHQLLEFTQTHVHRVGDAFQPSHPLSSVTAAWCPFLFLDPPKGDQWCPHDGKVFNGCKFSRHDTFINPSLE